MKQEQNNEMELLLRNLGRTAGATFKVDGQEEEHLDADELNAYAEKVLPPAAHTRYTKHIADCDRCRSIVSELSLAAGVIVEEERKEPVVAPTGWKALLVSFFSPNVLRYAVPALALVFVAWIGFVMFRQSSMNMERKAPSADSVAQRQAGNTQATGSPGLNDRVNAVREQPRLDKLGEAKPETPKQVKSNDDSSPAKEAKNDQPVVAADQVVSAQPGVVASSNAAEPPPAPKPTPVALEPATRRSLPAIAPAETVTVAKSNEKQADKDSKSVAQPGGSTFGISGPAKAKSEARGRGDSTRDEETAKRRETDDRTEAETKSVGGRRFRREGSIWIDVAFNSQSVTNVARGSEQYRALIADEPGIKTFADQLEGEVIVVWKGRAYKIK